MRKLIGPTSGAVDAARPFKLPGMTLSGNNRSIFLSRAAHGGGTVHWPAIMPV